MTIFDSGRGAGGRMSSRLVDDALQFDHGAVCFSSKLLKTDSNSSSSRNSLRDLFGQLEQDGTGTEATFEINSTVCDVLGSFLTYFSVTQWQAGTRASAPFGRLMVLGSSIKLEDHPRYLSVLYANVWY